MNICMQMPDSGRKLYPGNKVKLGKFESDYWTVNYGWYTWGGNRPVCGWYLVREMDKLTKPLQLTDLDDIYIIKL